MRNSLAKRAPGTARPAEEVDHAVRQIIAGAVAPEGVIDIFDAAGLPRPDVSILSDEFLAEVWDMLQRNLAVDLLRKLLEDDLRTRGRKSVVQSRSFAEMLAQTLLRYRNRAVETAQELVKTVRQNTTIDWTVQEDVRARLRVYVKRILRKHGYPPDKQATAMKTVLQQAEVLSAEWLREGP